MIIENADAGNIKGKQDISSVLKSSELRRQHFKTPLYFDCFIIMPPFEGIEKCNIFPSFCVLIFYLSHINVKLLKSMEAIKIRVAVYSM